jgi:hypothetical protein
VVSTWTSQRLSGDPDYSCFYSSKRSFWKGVTYDSLIGVNYDKACGHCWKTGTVPFELKPTLTGSAVADETGSSGDSSTAEEGEV